MRRFEVLVMAGLTLSWLAAVSVSQAGTPGGIVDAPCTAEVAVSADLKSFSESILKSNNKISAEVLQNLLKGPDFDQYMKWAREQRERDWPNLCKYKAANAALVKGPKPRVVFMGDSITENWAMADAKFFSDGVINRGIGGQTTPQMLVRFYADVIALRPRVVHLMAGTNDVGGATGPTTLRDYQNNMLAMIDLAQAHRIAVVLAAVPPVRKFYANDFDPRPRIREINAWLQQIAKERHLIFIDYGSVLADTDGGMKDTISNDDVHPTRAAYAQMRPLTERAIAQGMDH